MKRKFCSSILRDLGFSVREKTEFSRVYLYVTFHKMTRMVSMAMSLGPTEEVNKRVLYRVLGKRYLADLWGLDSKAQEQFVRKVKKYDKELAAFLYLEA